MGSGRSKQQPSQPQQTNVIVVQPKSDTRNIETQTGSLSELSRHPTEKRRVRRPPPTPTPTPTPSPSPTPTPSPSPPPTPPPKRRQKTPERSPTPAAPIDDDWNDNGERFEFYSDEFPTPQLLRKANEQYAQLGRRQPRRDDGVLLPYPAVTARELLYRPQDFVSIDRAADTTPTDLLYKPIQELVKYLTKSTFTELETIRVLYRWVSVHNVVDHTSQSSAAGTKSRHAAGRLETPDDFLQAIADGEQSYGDLLHVLFRFADIQSHIVNGVVKIRYGGTNDNDHVKEEHRNQKQQQQQQRRAAELDTGGQQTLLAYKTWTAVVIDGCWHLIDVQHEPPTEYIDGNDGSNELVCVQSNDVHSGRPGHKRGIDDSFFLMNPEHFVYSHYPTGDVWQLLARRVTMDEFEELANLTPSFFNLRLSVVDCPRRVVYDTDGELTLTVGQPLDAHYCFRCRLMRVTTANKTKQPADKETAASTTHDGHQLLRYVFLENLQGSMRCHVTFPAAGKYVLDIFCQDVDHTADAYDEKTSSTSRRSSYRLVCSYLAVARSAFADGGRVLPDSGPQQEWGPGWRLGVVGRLRPTTSGDSTVVVSGGELEMTFESTKTTSTPAAKYLVQLHRNTQSRNELKSYVIHSVDDVTGRLTIRAKFPQSGLYALGLFARHPSSSSSSSSASSTGFSNVCTYLLDVRRAADDQTPFPKIANGRLGSTDVGSSVAGLGFRAVSHPTPYLDVGSTDELEMTFGSSVAGSYLAELSLQRASTGHGGGTRSTTTKDCDNMTFVEEFVDGAVVHVRFPERGLYALKIFGKERSASGTYSQLFTYLIKVDRPSFVQYPFPCKYVHWSEGCELLRPTGLIGVLPANTVVQFVARVPRAFAVGATSQSARWTALRRVTVSERERFDVEGDDVWSGDVDTGSAGMLALSASFDGSSESGSRKTLLSFQVYESLKHSTHPTSQPVKREERELENNETPRNETETVKKPIVKHETFDKEDGDTRNRQQQQQQQPREDRRHGNDGDASLLRRTQSLRTEKKENKTADEELQRQKLQETSGRDKHDKDDQQNRKVVVTYRDSDNEQRAKVKEPVVKIERERHISDDDSSPAAIFLRSRRRKRAKSIGDDQQKETKTTLVAVDKRRNDDQRKEKRNAVEWKTEAEVERADDDEKKKQTRTKMENDEAKRREVNSLRSTENKKRPENNEQQNRQQRNKRLRTILQKSMESRDAPGLRSILDEIDRLRCQQAMEDDYGRGRDVLESLTRVERIKEAIVCTNRATMAEIRGYQRPPDSLRKVLVATLLVLGEDEESTESWQSCQRLCSTVAPDNILKRVVNFHLEDLHPEIATRALQILGDCPPQDVRDACLGAAIFYDWTSGVCRERLDMNDVANDVQPASDVRRQRLLLKKMSVE